MKAIYKIYLCVAALTLAACSKTEKEGGQASVPRTPVAVVTVKTGSINNDITLFGSTVYLKKNVVAAPIPSFITRVNVKLGDKVSRGEVLYILQSKESRALGSDPTIDNNLKGFGIISVKASASGIITTLDRQEVGEYVLEGSQLCSIAGSNDLAFQVNVPFEYTRYTTTGKGCTITLPDNSVHDATFTRALTTMNALSQTQTILAKSNTALFLPENMVVKVATGKGKANTRQLLPKACVSTDEMMKEFWVMKVTNDSTAVKVMVTIGNKSEDAIEIIRPVFNAGDRIISEGNFGMADTALIKIVNNVNGDGNGKKQ